jgi:hypothetical protein
MSAPGKGGDGVAAQRLAMEATVKTYRYLDDATVE